MNVTDVFVYLFMYLLFCSIRTKCVYRAFVEPAYILLTLFPATNPVTVARCPCCPETRTQQHPAASQAAVPALLQHGPVFGPDVSRYRPACSVGAYR